MAKAPTTLFIGNGVNRLITNDHAWDSLIKNLAKRSNASHVIDLLKEKPFTLVYEEIREAFVREHRKLNQTGSAEKQLKEEIAASMEKIDPGDIHKEICALNFDHLITTNYDYALEKALGDSPGNILGRKLETKYSLYRFRRSANKQCWHIHGEAMTPWSICLGQDHYSGYLQKIREAIVTPKDDRRENERESDRGHIPKFLANYWRSGNIDFWPQLFFTGSLDIIGFGFDYTEIDLWWLIAYRARRMSSSNKQPFKLGEVTFHQFVSEGGLEKREEGRLGILKSLGVKVNRIDFKSDYRKAYEKWIASYRNRTGATP